MNVTGNKEQVTVTLSLIEATRLANSLLGFARTSQGDLKDRLERVLKTIPLADRLEAEADEVRTWDRCPVQTFEGRLREIAREVRG